MDYTSRKLFEIIVNFVYKAKAGRSTNSMFRSIFRTQTLIDYLDNGFGGNAWIQVFGDGEIVLEAETGCRQSGAMVVATTNPFPRFKTWEDYERTAGRIETCLRAVVAALKKRISDAALRKAGLDDIPSSEDAVETDYHALVDEAVTRLLQSPEKAMVAAGLVYGGSSVRPGMARFKFPVGGDNLAFITILQNSDSSYGCHCEVGAKSILRRNVTCRKDHDPSKEDCSEEVARHVYQGLVEVLARV